MGTQTSGSSTRFEDGASTTVAVNPPDRPALSADSPDTTVNPRLTSTRASRAWIRLLPAFVLLGMMLVFVLQNLHHTKVSFLGFAGTLPLAVALLAAAALGGLFVLAVGSVRIVQLRRVIRHQRHSRQR